MKREILYVDDEPSNLVVFEASFEADFTVHTAESAQQALEILEKFAVPVVVADQRMPGMTGVEMFRVLRRKYPHVQRVILSGYSDSDAIIDAINEGQVYQFVRKPWKRVELLTVLRRALDVHDMSLQNSTLMDQLLISERSAALGQATGEIAHEMANQLNMLPLIEIIEDEYSSDERLMQLASIARQTHDRLTQLIDEVRNFMRFDTAAVELEPTNLGESLREFASFLRFQKVVPASQLKVEVMADLWVMASQLKLNQILVNLVKNASDAIVGFEGAFVLVKLQQMAKEAVITVSDTGTGIAPEILDRIWTPFFSTKGNQGNGMGLDITKRLVEKLQGTIVCESTLGAGTTFTIRLPLIAEPSSAGS